MIKDYYLNVFKTKDLLFIMINILDFYYNRQETLKFSKLFFVYYIQ